MTKAETIANFKAYMQLHNIPYMEDCGNGVLKYIMHYRAEDAPMGYVESCIWFYDDAAEVRAYYNATGADICKKSKYHDRLFRLLNYINAQVFLSCRDASGLYNSHMLYTPRIYMTTDDCFDLTITTMINYDFWEVAPVETCDYITCYCPELLDKFAYPIFSVLLGENTVEKAVDYIENNILNLSE